MASRRKLFFVVCTTVLTTMTVVSAFTCNVCLPAVKGTKSSKDQAMLIRANITRTWPDVPERELGECSQLQRTSKFMLECPIDDEYSACTKIYNDYWFALTCGRMTEQRAAGCFSMQAGYKLCNCVTPLCNSPAVRPVSVAGVLGASLAAAALLRRSI